MTKPDKPIEAQGLGCGMIVSIVAVSFTLSWLGLPPGPSILIAMVLAAISLLVYMGNQFKAQKILNHEYKKILADGGAAPRPLSAHSSGGDSEGMYCVVGVDKESGMDTTWHTHASSAANAKVKGELLGIIVTGVTKA